MPGAACGHYGSCSATAVSRNSSASPSTPLYLSLSFESYTQPRSPKKGQTNAFSLPWTTVMQPDTRHRSPCKVECKLQLSGSSGNTVLQAWYGSLSLSLSRARAVSGCDVAFYLPAYYFKAVAAAEYEIGPPSSFSFTRQHPPCYHVWGSVFGPLAPACIIIMSGCDGAERGKIPDVRVVTGALEHDV